jgi:serine/threonine-protein kinase
MPTPDRRDAGRNLLFGLLAFQLNFIDRAALLGAFDDWVAQKSRRLADRLVERGALTAARRAVLDALVDEHLHLHGDDPEQSLAHLDVAEPLRQALASIADPDLHATLNHIAADSRDGRDPDSTRTWSLGQATSAGSRFLVLHEHARGGLGIVSVALDSELNRRVALKELQSEKADSPGLRARFEAEAEITGKLEHPGVVPVYGLGHDAQGRPYYAMRFIQGESLKDAVGRYHRPDTATVSPGERAVMFRDLLGRFLDLCNAVA